MANIRVRSWIGAAAAAMGCVWMGLPATPAIDVGSRKQLFIDHKFIESAEGLSLVTNPPWRTGEVVLEPDAPWEKGTVIGSYSTVVQENGRVRLWYNTLGNTNLPGKNPDFMGVA